MNDFDWDDESVVFPTTQGVAVYLNDERNVIIRQKAGPCEEDDSFILIPRDRLPDLLDALHTIYDEPRVAE